MLSILMVLILILTVSLSPISICMSMVIISLSLSANLYNITGSLFNSMAMVISFSSGMMILFCYCTILINYEQSYKSNKLIKYCSSFMMMTMVLTFSGDTLITSDSYKNEVMLNTQNFLMIWMMSVVMLSMLCINKTMYFPNKPLMDSY